MTISQLIEKLQELPGDWTVLLYDRRSDGEEDYSSEEEVESLSPCRYGNGPFDVHNAVLLDF